MDVDKRTAQHQSGRGAKYTRTRLPVKLLYQELHENHSAALKRESQIKRWTRTRKKSLIQTRI